MTGQMYISLVLLVLTLALTPSNAQTASCDGAVVSLYWECDSQKSSVAYLPMVVSHENRDLNIRMIVKPDQHEVESIEITFESEDDGFVGLYTRNFIFSEIWASDQWATRAYFDKAAPLGTYYATVTVTQKNGESHTCNHEYLQDSYFQDRRNLYGIQFVGTVKDMVTPSVELTEFSMPDSVDLSGGDKSMNITVGFSTPIGVWDGELSILPPGSRSNYLCHDPNPQSGLPELQLSYEGSHQTNGGFTKGVYTMRCDFSGYAEPGVYEASLTLTDYARKTTVYPKSKIHAAGFNTSIVVT